MVKIEDSILEFIENHDKKDFEINKLYLWLKEKDRVLFDFIMTAEGRLQFAESISWLVAQVKIEPVKNSLTIPLFAGQSIKAKYRILALSDVVHEQEEALNLMKRYDRRIPNLKYYKNNPSVFIQDKTYIDIIYDFIGQLLDNPDMTPLSVHERSWQLFQDEKFIKNSSSGASGARILSNLGLTYNDLNCYMTYEPFVFYKTKVFDVIDVRNILIIENKDTFWSFKKIMEDDANSLNMHLLIYGEGNKIVKSLQYLESVGGLTSDNIYYFGDIDREGINIFSKLQSEYSGIYTITPATSLYQWCLNDVSIEKLVATKKEQRLSEESVESFCAFFDESSSIKIKHILDEGKYIPQEAMNYMILENLFIKGISTSTLNEPMELHNE